MLDSYINFHTKEALLINSKIYIIVG